MGLIFNLEGKGPWKGPASSCEHLRFSGCPSDCRVSPSLHSAHDAQAHALAAQAASSVALPWRHLGTRRRSPGSSGGQLLPQPRARARHGRARAPRGQGAAQPGALRPSGAVVLSCPGPVAGVAGARAG
jgi:hypothetical protein